MAKWVHLTSAPDQITAEIWVDILRDQGIGAMIHPADTISFLGLSTASCRIQVTEADLARAQEVVGEITEEAE